MVDGTFITFEGGEGSGKSTQARLLADRLGAAGRRVRLTREPGGSPFAEDVRAIVMARERAPKSPLAEALLFYAARADHLCEVIAPALAAGDWVISDRFSDSTRVYQGIAGGLGLATVDTLERLVVGAQAPRLTLLLDLDPAIGLARAGRRRGEAGEAEADNFEMRQLAFHQSLRDGFLAIAAAEPNRVVVVDATQSVDAIAGQIWRTVSERLGPL